MPVVSPNEAESAPSAMARPATDTVRATGTSPSYGQPHAVDTMTWSVAPRACASAMISAISSSDSPVDRLTFLRLCVSDAETTASSSVKPASRARRAPRRLGTSAEYLTEGAFAARFHTSSASAICGIADGRTNDTASILRTPVVDSASRSATFASVGTGSSFCSPSLGPTSRTEIASGSSQLMMSRLTGDGSRPSRPVRACRFCHARRKLQCSSYNFSQVARFVLRTSWRCGVDAHGLTRRQLLGRAGVAVASVGGLAAAGVTGYAGPGPAAAATTGGPAPAPAPRQGCSTS